MARRTALATCRRRPVGLRTDPRHRRHGCTGASRAHARCAPSRRPRSCRRRGSSRPRSAGSGRAQRNCRRRAWTEPGRRPERSLRPARTDTHDRTCPGIAARSLARRRHEAESARPQSQSCLRRSQKRAPRGIGHGPMRSRKARQQKSIGAKDVPRDRRSLRTDMALPYVTSVRFPIVFVTPDERIPQRLPPVTGSPSMNAEATERAASPSR